MMNMRKAILKAANEQVAQSSGRMQYTVPFKIMVADYIIKYDSTAAGASVSISNRAFREALEELLPTLFKISTWGLDWHGSAVNWVKQRKSGVLVLENAVSVTTKLKTSKVAKTEGRPYAEIARELEDITKAAEQWEKNEAELIGHLELCRKLIAKSRETRKALLLEMANAL